MYNPLSLLTKSIALRKNDLSTTGKIILTMKNMYNFYLGILLQVLICDMFDFLNEYLLENICKENIANLINNMQKKSWLSLLRSGVHLEFLSSLVQIISFYYLFALDFIFFLLLLYIKWCVVSLNFIYINSIHV